MPVVYSVFLFLGSLPPFNFPLIGCFFLVPLLLDRKNQAQKHVAQNGLLFALIVSAYSYFGTWSYDIYAYLAMVSIYSLLFMVFLYCTFLMIINRDVLAILVAPLLWVFIELALEALNLPVTLAITLTTTPALLLPAQYGGQHLLSFLLIGFQLAVIVIYRRFHNRQRVAMPAYLLALILISFLHPAILADTPSPQTDTIDISVVQTNAHPRNTLAMASDGMLEGLAQERQSLLENIFTSTIKPQLVIWPEVSMAKYEFRKKDNISRQAAQYGVSMLVASPDQSPSGQTYNSIFSLSSSGSILNRYNKNILIPFLESKSTGQETWPLHDQLPGRPGSIICYESVFPRPAALLSAAGAGFISLSTNDAYAGPSILPALHLQFSRIRAIETGKTIVRAANAGPSAVISADGKIASRLELYESGIIHARIQPDYSMTFFVRHYHSLFIILWILASLAVMIFVITIARSSKFNLSGQSISVGHVVISMALLCCMLIFQYFYMRHIYQTNSGSNVPAGFINFQQGHIPDALPYTKLKVDTPGDSLLSAITYLLRDYGNNVTLERIRGVLNKVSEDHNEISNAIDINAIIGSFDYTTSSEEHPNKLAVSPKHIKTPCLALLATGETVVISEYTDAGVIFFSPFYGEILAIKTAAFMKKWTGKTLTLSTRRKPWDI